MKLVPLEILYAKPHNAAIGKMWDKHHFEFYEFINPYISGNVIEIGGGNLKLANYLAKENKIKKITIYDTNEYDLRKSEKIVQKKEFFDSKNLVEQPDAIIHSHLLEHLYNPIKQLREMAETMPDHSKMAIAVPLIDEMLKDKFTNAMNFEHTYMTSYKLIKRMLSLAKLKILDNKVVFIYRLKLS